MMDANMPEMAENPKQEETPESIITNEPQMVEEIGGAGFGRKCIKGYT